MSNNKRVFIAVDVSNLFCCVRNKFDKKIDYQKFLRHCAKFGEIYQSAAFAASLKGEGEPFFKRLRYLGFRVHVKEVKEYQGKDGRAIRKADWDVGIAMSIARVIDRVDIVVLGTADGDLLPVLEFCHEKGVQVVIVGCNISSTLRDKADICVEITEDMLETKRATPETTK